MAPQWLRPEETVNQAVWSRPKESSGITLQGHEVGSESCPSPMSCYTFYLHIHILSGLFSLNVRLHLGQNIQREKLLNTPIKKQRWGTKLEMRGADFTFYKQWEGMTSEHLNCENTSHLVGKTRLKNKRTTIIEKNLNLGSTSQLHGNSN